MKRQNPEKLFNDVINNYSSEDIKALAEGEYAAHDVLSPEDRKKLGALIDPDYPKFAEIYVPVRDAECMMRWAEHEMYFKAGWAFGRRHKHARLRCARNRPGE
jgi:hypothetical protein